MTPHDQKRAADLAEYLATRPGATVRVFAVDRRLAPGHVVELRISAPVTDAEALAQYTPRHLLGVPA